MAAKKVNKSNNQQDDAAENRQANSDFYAQRKKRRDFDKTNQGKAESRIRNSDFIKYWNERNKRDNAFYVEKSVDYGGGMGGTAEYVRNPGGAGFRGISPAAIQRVAENKQYEADKKATKLKNKKTSKSPKN